MQSSIDSDLMLEREEERVMAALAESLLEMSESQILGEARQEGEDPTSVAKRTRMLLWSHAKVSRQKPLFDALEEYRRQVERMRSRDYVMPATPEERRTLMTSLFERYPQMHSAFVTVQHREFKSWSDADIESFLRQMQELGALSPKEVSRALEPQPEPSSKKDNREE